MYPSRRNSRRTVSADGRRSRRAGWWRSSGTAHAAAYPPRFWGERPSRSPQNLTPAVRQPAGTARAVAVPEGGRVVAAGGDPDPAVDDPGSDPPPGGDGRDGFAPADLPQSQGLAVHPSVRRRAELSLQPSPLPGGQRQDVHGRPPQSEAIRPCTRAKRLLPTCISPCRATKVGRHPSSGGNPIFARRGDHASVSGQPRLPGSTGCEHQLGRFNGTAAGFHRGCRATPCVAESLLLGCRRRIARSPRNVLDIARPLSSRE
jgi:hypothetical protein